MEETIKMYKRRRHAKNDQPLKPQIKMKCAGCKSNDTILIYKYDYLKTYDYGDNAGWINEEYITEYKCKKCGKYMVHEISGYQREYYTR